MPIKNNEWNEVEFRAKIYMKIRPFHSISLKIKMERSGMNKLLPIILYTIINKA